MPKEPEMPEVDTPLPLSGTYAEGHSHQPKELKIVK
jgi:hypothetical protein